MSKTLSLKSEKPKAQVDMLKHKIIQPIIHWAVASILMRP